MNSSSSYSSMEGVIYVNKHDGTIATIIEYDSQEKVYTLEMNYTEDNSQEGVSIGKKADGDMICLSSIGASRYNYKIYG